MAKVKKFLRCVKARKCLYDTNIKEYYDLAVKENAWESISAEMKAEVSVLKARWKVLRETYFREKKIHEEAGSLVDPAWPYFIPMNFLSDFSTSKRISTSNTCGTDDEKLVNLVRIHNCLYDKSTRGYTASTIKEKAWNEIAELMNDNISDVKTRWKSLRDRYVREKKFLENPSTSTSDQKSFWGLYSQLDFLRDFVKPRKRHTTEAAEVPESDFTWPVKEEEEEGQMEKQESEDWEESSVISLPDSPDLVTKVEVEDAMIDTDSADIAQKPDSQYQIPQPPQPQLDLTSRYVSIIDEKLRHFPEREREQISMEIITMLNNRIYES